MAVKLIFSFMLSLLKQEADYVLDAAEKFAVQLNPRLPADFVASQRALLGTVRGESSAQKFKTADVGDLTLEQNNALKEMNRLIHDARGSAKRAFKGHHVKLRNDFQVGINSPSDLGSLLSRARIVCDSCAQAENAPVLAAKGWIADDTTALNAAIEALDTTDDTQEDTKVDKKGVTNTRNAAANELYEGLLTIQNAANRQWPNNGNGNTAMRAKFRIGVFPPKQIRKKQTPPPPPPAPPA